MACVSVEEGSDDLLTISDAFRCLVSNLEVFRDVATKVELGTGNEAEHSGHGQTSSSFVRLVAGTLKEMVGKLVSDFEGKPEIQSLLFVNRKSVSAAANDRATISKQPSCVVGTQPSAAVCISGRDARSMKRAAVRGVATCRHSCASHLEVMDPVLWSTLPEEVVELVFGKLPISKIADLYNDSLAWFTISKSSNFRRVAAERHPKLFGLVWCDRRGTSVLNVMYDIELKRSCGTDVDGFPTVPDVNPNAGGNVKDEIGYGDLMYSCDGGLVCFVPKQNFLVHPILVANPLTDEWKTLPHPVIENKKPILVQLVREEGTKSYKVILVCSNEIGEDLAASCFNSRTREWSVMDSGLVYGGLQDLTLAQMVDPCVFDCSTKTLHHLCDCSTLREELFVRRVTMVKDRLVVLHGCRHSSDLYKISEYSWDSTTSDLRRLSTIDSTLLMDLPSNYEVHLFSSSGYVLLFGDNRERGEYQSQITRLYDSTTKQWHNLTWEEEDRFYSTELYATYMCELQWDAVP